ncbi:hypothetical protein [Bradyrhizobium genosp. A]|uniref:hypothetical protein n=1 Tax=Bradyrhizobium genosp. A TaxID=83626 RepID=UPI003CF5078D
MLYSEPSANATDRLIDVLETTIAKLVPHAQPEHRFRFVSAAQSLPYSAAYALWIKGGEVGPQPVASVAEMRASVYNQAESASELRAFTKVAAVAGVELAEATLAGLRAGHIILTYTALRGLIERIAHAVATAALLKRIGDAPLDGPLTPILELSETIHKALYATQREWAKLVKSDFRTTSVKDVQYVKKPNIANALPDNILKSVDRLEKTVAGTRLVYEVLCEYLHPNVGDLWGATLEAESSIDAHGTRHLTRCIGLGPKTYKGLADQQIIREKLFDVCCDIIVRMPITLDEIASLADRATRLTRRFAHGVVKNYRKQFLSSDPCPCLSGKTVAACTGLRDR